MALAEGYAERFTPKTGGQIIARYTGTMSAATAQVEPDGMELTRSGRRFFLNSLGATGQAPVQALPATGVAQWVLFNTSTTVSLVIDSVGVGMASGTAGTGIVVVATLFQTPAQTGFTSGVSVLNASGNSTRTSVVAVKSNITITGPATAIWVPIAQNKNTNTAVLEAMAVNDDIRGRYIVPPLTGLGLSVISPTGTNPLFVPVACWTELESDLE
jgi:hypothetical protein